MHASNTKARSNHFKVSFDHIASNNDSSAVPDAPQSGRDSRAFDTLKHICATELMSSSFDSKRGTAQPQQMQPLQLPLPFRNTVDNVSVIAASANAHDDATASKHKQTPSFNVSLPL